MIETIFRTRTRKTKPRVSSLEALASVFMACMFWGDTSYAQVSDSEASRIKNIHQAINADTADDAWREECESENGNGYAFSDFSSGRPDLSVYMPVTVLNDLKHYVDACSAGMMPCRSHFQGNYITNPDFDINGPEKVCVEDAFSKSEDDFLKITTKINVLFSKFNGLTMNPVPFEDYDSPKDAGWTSARTIVDIEGGDDGVLEVWGDMAGQPYNVTTRIRQCFKTPIPETQIQLMKSLGITIPQLQLPYHVVD